MSRTIALGMLAAAVLAGCAARPPVAFTQDKRFDAVWEAAEATLRDYRFTVDRADRRAGIITTFPLVGQYGFEFWRKDAVTGRDVVEGMLHHVTRQATVTLRKAPAGAGGDAAPGYVAEVQVHTTRSTRPEYQITSAADAYDMFLGGSRVGRGYAMDEARQGKAGGNWDALGRDKALEAALHKAIVQRTAQHLAADSGATGPAPAPRAGSGGAQTPG